MVQWQRMTNYWIPVRWKEADGLTNYGPVAKNDGLVPAANQRSSRFFRGRYLACVVSVVAVVVVVVDPER